LIFTDKSIIASCVQTTLLVVDIYGIGSARPSMHVETAY